MDRHKVVFLKDLCVHVQGVHRFEGNFLYMCILSFFFTRHRLYKKRIHVRIRIFTMDTMDTMDSKY